MAHQSGTAASTTPSHTATISSRPPNRDQHRASPNSSHRSIPPPPAQPPERKRCQGAAPHWRNDLDSAEHRHIIDGGGTSLVTHNYVDIMSRIYVDSTPAGTGSKRAEGAQGRNSGIAGERTTAPGCKPAERRSGHRPGPLQGSYCRAELR